MTYNGYVVEPSCRLLPDKWQVRVRIERHKSPLGPVLTEYYDSEETCSDKDEADSRAIEFGQQIIDGNCSPLTPPCGSTRDIDFP